MKFIRRLYLVICILAGVAVAQPPSIFGDKVAQAGQSLSGLVLPARDMVALDNDGNLWRRPGQSGLNFRTELPVRGVLGQLIGIDYRPADGKLYGLDDWGNLYTIDTSRPNFAIALLVSVLTIDFDGGVQSLFDFNPAVNALRLIGSNDQNYAVVNNNGGNLNLTVMQTKIAYALGDVNVGADPNLCGGAYTNNRAGAANTIFYALDFGTDALVSIAPPLVNNSSNTGGGQLRTIGQVLGSGGFTLNFTPTADIDIYTDLNGNNFLVGVTGSTLFTVDLAQINPNLPLGQTQTVIARSMMIPDGGFIDIAVRP